MNKNVDTMLSRVLLVISVFVIFFWVWNGLIWLWGWYLDVRGSTVTTVWEEIKHFFLDNLSIIALVYGIISLQTAGVAELKFEKKFLKAFLMAILLTPPVMMGVYGYKKQN